MIDYVLSLLESVFYIFVALVSLAIIHFAPLALRHLRHWWNSKQGR